MSDEARRSEAEPVQDESPVEDAKAGSASEQQRERGHVVETGLALSLFGIEVRGG